MTTNLSLNQIDRLLDEANHKDPNIRISASIGLSVEFLDVCVQNSHGQLKTTVFHKPAAEPYIVPFLSDHPRRIHRNVIRGALFRAVRLCSDVQDFDTERLNIELKLLLNGYPPQFIAYHFKHFFEQQNAMSLMEQLDNVLYAEIHHRIIHQLTRREKRQQREDMRYRRSQLLFDEIQDQQPVSPSPVAKKEIHVSFTFESGPMLDFKRELDCLWKQYYHCNNSPLNDVKLKISAQRNRSLSQLLIHKKPSKSMLSNAPSSEKK